MHRAWFIDDIWRLLVARFASADLAVLAQTCSALFALATAELWGTITSFAPFLSCLPRGYRHRELVSKDLERLDYYASKVRILVLESKDIERPIRLPTAFLPIQGKKAKEQATERPKKSWEELWAKIATLRPQQGFLKELQSMRINNAAAEYLIPITGISGERLQKVYIRYLHGRQSSPLTVKFLKDLRDVSKLQYLFVRDGEDLLPPRVIEEAPLKHIRLDPRISAGRHADLHFKKGPLRCDILEKATLEHLTIALTRDWYTPEVRASIEKQKRLPALKSLWLNLTTFKPDRCPPVCNNFGHDSWTCLPESPIHQIAGPIASDCSRRPPTLFLEALEHPSLELLNIKFPLEATARMFFDVVSAAQNNCELSNLTELALAGGGWFDNCMECGKRPPPKITPEELRQALRVLLPLPKLKILRLSVAPNFLDVLDLDLYKEITDQLHSIEKLWLGHSEFFASSIFHGITSYERVPLHHVAAFCHMLPNLVEVSVGGVDGLVLEKHPKAEWACPNVKDLKVAHWAGRDSASGGVSRDKLHLSVRTYFPESDLAKRELNERMWIFE